jgi:hypothetical protein
MGLSWGCVAVQFGWTGGLNFFQILPCPDGRGSGLQLKHGFRRVGKPLAGEFPEGEQ